MWHPPRQAELARWRAALTDFLLDRDGTVGRRCDACATSQIVVIDRGGRLVYMGANGDKPSTRTKIGAPIIEFVGRQRAVGDA
jgi:hypothetical protein